jgi:hypothetical protein
MPRSTRLTRRLFTLAFAASLISVTSCITISEPGEGLAVFSIVGGNNQVVVVGTMAPQPLRVRALDESTGAMPGVDINWSIVSGTGVLSTTSTTTDESGYSAINFTASSTVGPVLVRAAAQDLRLTFTVEVVNAPPA